MAISYHSAKAKKWSLKRTLFTFLAVLLCVQSGILAFGFGSNFFRTHQKSPFSFPGTTWRSDTPQIELEIPEGVESCFVDDANCYETRCKLYRGDRAIEAIFLIYEGDNYFYFYESQKEHGVNRLFYGNYYYQHGDVLLDVRNDRPELYDNWWEQYDTIVLKQTDT